MPPLADRTLPAPHQTAYCVLTLRAGQHAVEFFPISLREPLPTIPIPLRKTDEDVALNLQALIQQAYINGRYDDLDYSKPAIPPLETEDAAWAGELLRPILTRR